MTKLFNLDRIPCTISNLMRFFILTFQLRHNGNLKIARDCYFDKPSQVLFGKDVFINKKVQFHVGSGSDENVNIYIGDNVWVGFICATHMIGDKTQRAGEKVHQSISIGKGTWIGARATILPNVSIGEGCAIAAGSVVTKDIPANTLSGGVPCKVLKYF